MSEPNRVDGQGRLVVDLLLLRDRVSLHVLPEKDEPSDANKRFELSIDPALGTRDTNWGLMRQLQGRKQMDIDRQTGDSG